MSPSSRSGCTGTVRFTAPEMLCEMNDDGITAGGGFSLRRQYSHGWTKQVTTTKPKTETLKLYTLKQMSTLHHKTFTTQQKA